jgi:tartrate dehydratase beta subunit/fumarate hydratase class I family protein
VVEDFPVVVVNDLEGRDLFQEGKARYRLGGPIQE